MELLFICALLIYYILNKPVYFAVKNPAFMMEGSVKGPVSVAESADDEDDEDEGLDSALDVLGMIPLTYEEGIKKWNNLKKS